MDHTTEAEKFRLAVDMYEVGMELQRQRFRRRNPQASPAEIEAELYAWQLRRATSRAATHPGRLSTARFA